jgi:hypothetical protein
MKHCTLTSGDCVLQTLGLGVCVCTVLGFIQISPCWLVHAYLAGGVGHFQLTCTSVYSMGRFMYCTADDWVEGGGSIKIDLICSVRLKVHFLRIFSAWDSWFTKFRRSRQPSQLSKNWEGCRARTGKLNWGGRRGVCRCENSFLPLSLSINYKHDTVKVLRWQEVSKLVFW